MREIDILSITENSYIVIVIWERLISFVSVIPPSCWVVDVLVWFMYAFMKVDLPTPLSPITAIYILDIFCSVVILKYT